LEIPPLDDGAIGVVELVSAMTDGEGTPTAVLEVAPITLAGSSYGAGITDQ